MLPQHRSFCKGPKYSKKMWSNIEQILDQENWGIFYTERFWSFWIASKPNILPSLIFPGSLQNCWNSIVIRGVSKLPPTWFFLATIWSWCLMYPSQRQGEYKTHPSSASGSMDVIWQNVTSPSHSVMRWLHFAHFSYVFSHTRGEGDIRTQGIRTSEKKLIENFYPSSPPFLREL